MKKTGILNAELMYELTRMRHTDKIVICDAGFPVPEGKKLVDLSLVAGLPTVSQVFKAICNEIVIESIPLPTGFDRVRGDFYQELKAKFLNHEFTEMPSQEMFKRVYDPDVKLFIRTGDVQPCGNMLLSSASGVPRAVPKWDVSFDSVI